MKKEDMFLMTAFLTGFSLIITLVAYEQNEPAIWGAAVMFSFGAWTAMAVIVGSMLG